MAPKQAPRRGAKSRATARPIPTDVDPPTERRTKRCHDPAEQPGLSSASPSSAKRGRASSSGRGRGSAYPRRKILDSSPEVSEKSTSSSLESSQSSKRTPSKPLSAGKTILKPRAVDLEDSELNAAFPEVLNFFKFQSWQPFISEFRIIYPRLVQEFYMHLECTDEGYKSKVKGIEIDMPTDIGATIFKIPDEGEDYHNFEFNLHKAYTILTGLPADESDLKQTHVRRGPAAVEAPVVQEEQPPVQEDQPPAPEDQPQVHEDQPPMNEDQPHVAAQVDEPFNAPLSPQLQPSSSMNLETEIPSFSPQPPVDTKCRQVDTRWLSQKACFSDGQSRSTRDDIRSTLESLPRRAVCCLGHGVDTESSQVNTRDLSQGIDLPVWDSVSTHLMGRSTHSGISVT
ncbi:hypothetical protein Taro_047391 [Colocasia esculenta]|uniref:Uncharacterized protein n=1 Tax=Colocasia esculenta TaxID=4460 RepID=A0A843WST4_COLES|nr:hypothetical protein [Colocasia esculenta]